MMHTRPIAFVIIFAICRVAGVMCTLPDLSPIQETMSLVEGRSGMMCLVGDALMCPPAVTSNPERQAKDNVTLDKDHSQNVVTAVPTTHQFWDHKIRSGNDVHFLIPISIASSSVLRI